MKTIEQKIKAIASQMGINYIYDDWTTANVRLDTAQLPVMVNVLPVNGTLSMNGYQLVRSASCMVAFLDKTEFDFDGEQNDSIVDRMMQHAMAFVLLANRSGEFEPIGDEDINVQVCYDTADVNLTGVILELNLKETSGVCTTVKPLTLIGKDE